MLSLSEWSSGLWSAELPAPRSAAPARLSMGASGYSPGDDRNREQVKLLAAMARGDRIALGRLYDQVSGPLYSLALRVLADAAEAQDLIQDIFVQAWRTAGTYDADRGTVFSWLATLTRNRAIDRLRMRRRRAELLAAAAPDLQPAPVSFETDSGQSLWIREKAAAVRAALADLPADQRHAIELAYFGGLTQQEIAARLNEPLGTVKARMRRGLLKLKDHLPARL